MVLEEIFMANGTAIIMMAFLLFCRSRNRESIHGDDRIYDCMTIVTILGGRIRDPFFRRKQAELRRCALPQLSLEQHFLPGHGRHRLPVVPLRRPAYL